MEAEVMEYGDLAEEKQQEMRSEAQKYYHANEGAISKVQQKVKVPSKSNGPTLHYYVWLKFNNLI